MPDHVLSNNAHRPYTHKQSAGWGKNARRQGALKAAALTALPRLQHAREGVFLAAAPPELDDQATGLEPPHRLLGAQPSLTIACCCSCHTFCAALAQTCPVPPKASNHEATFVAPPLAKPPQSPGSPPSSQTAPKYSAPPGLAATSSLSPNQPSTNIEKK